MRILILAPFASIGLDKTRVIEVVHPIERICRNENNSGVGVNFPFSISEFDGLQNYTGGECQPSTKNASPRWED